MITPLRIAHRGASGPGLAPENTLAACEKALQIGVDMLEIDVHATRDGQIVVLHDAALDRTTNGTGLVADLLGEEVRQFDAGRWFSADFARERVPLLEEVLDLARNQALVLIEIKADGIAERVLQVIEAANATERVVVQAFNPQTVRRLNLLAPTLPTALLVGQLPTTPLASARPPPRAPSAASGGQRAGDVVRGADPALPRRDAPAGHCGLGLDR